MTSTLLDFPAADFPLQSAAGGQGGRGTDEITPALSEMSVLELIKLYEDAFRCEKCGAEKRAIEHRFGELRWISCQSCGEERVVRWTRTNSEGM
jgi:hypothetical protein